MKSEQLLNLIISKSSNILHKQKEKISIYTYVFVKCFLRYKDISCVLQTQEVVGINVEIKLILSSFLIVWLHLQTPSKDA